MHDVINKKRVCDLMRFQKYGSERANDKEETE